MRIISFGKSDPGLKRINNEDSFVIKPDPVLLVVSDGMGGEAAGEIASTILTETAIEVFSDKAESSQKETSELIQKVFNKANQRILDHIKHYPHHRGMGCTAEVMVFTDDGYVAGHVGDSRIYLLRSGKFTQITEDHSLVQEQLNRGLITEIEASTHPLRNILLRAVGSKEPFMVDIIRGTIYPDDLFLLCSDGLTTMLDDIMIKHVLGSPTPVSQKVEALIEMANNAGGFDNITVVISQIIGNES